MWYYSESSCWVEMLTKGKTKGSRAMEHLKNLDKSLPHPYSGASEFASGGCIVISRDSTAIQYRPFAT